MDATSPNEIRDVLVVGASRGLGEAIVEEYVARGAHVVATVRGDAPNPLRAFAATRPGDVEVEQVDVTAQGDLVALRERLAPRMFDVLFVVAGVSLAPQEQPGADIADADFDTMMRTNVLGVMRTVETLQDLVPPTGTIAVMSSGQGSVSANTTGGFEVYRATKAALNQMFRSYAARHADEARSLLLLAPGWVRTAPGGPGASLEVGEAIPPLLDVVAAQRGRAGQQFLDRHGEPLPW